MNKFYRTLALAALIAMPATGSFAQSAEPAAVSLERLMELVRSGTATERTAERKRVADFQREKSTQQKRLRDSRAEQARLQRRSKQLEDQFDANERQITALEDQLKKRQEMGAAECAAEVLAEPLVEVGVQFFTAQSQEP